jgi:hypothetical protein
LILRFMGVKNLEGDVDGNEAKTVWKICYCYRRNGL